MSKLILVRHSLPEIVPTEPASRWHLSEKGRQRCKPLAARLAALHPDIVITSIEPKAIETGQMVAHLLNKPVEISEGLHEHCRANVPFGGIDQFEAAVARFFAQPGDLVFGTETADEAYQRFSRAVNTVSVTHPAKTPAIVTHGTVLALFVSRVAGLRPFPFWQRLGLPAFAVLSVPAFCLEIVVEGVNDQD